MTPPTVSPSALVTVKLARVESAVDASTASASSLAAGVECNLASRHILVLADSAIGYFPLDFGLERAAAAFCLVREMSALAFSTARMLSCLVAAISCCLLLASRDISICF